MRRLIALVLVVAALWSGYWVMGTRALEAGVRSWITSARASGLEVGEAGVSVRGFPNRFDLTVEAPAIRDPGTGFGWRADRLQSLMMGWKPWHVILVTSPAQVVVTPAGELPLTGEGLAASLVLVPGRSLELNRLRLTGKALVLDLPGGRLALDELRLATERDAAAPRQHKLGVELLGLTGTLAGLPAGEGHLRLDAALEFSAPPALLAGGQPPRPEAITLKEARLDWGAVSLAATGRLEADAQGYAAGRLELTATGLETLVPLAVGLGLVAPGAQDGLTAMVRRMQATAGEGKPVSLPLTLSGGRVRIGPLPIGPAPRLR